MTGYAQNYNPTSRKSLDLITGVIISEHKIQLTNETREMKVAVFL